MKKSLVFIFLIPFILALVLLPSMPAQVPNHWNAAGEIDGYGSKYWNLLFALLPVGIYLLMDLLKKIDPKTKNYQRNPKTFELMKIVIASMMALLTIVIILASKYPSLPINKVLPVIIGLAFMLMGNYMPKIKQNYFMGIKTPWALADENNWNKTHRFGGKVFMLMGLTILITIFFEGAIIIYLLLLSIFGGTALTFYYSYYLFKKESKNK